MAAPASFAPPREGRLFRVVEAWALLGGAVLLSVALLTAWSAAGAALLGRPLPGDVELTEMLTAVAVFMFLPYCQITGANVTADVFTARAGPATVALFALVASIVAALFSALLAWRMYAGLLDYREFVETTTILRIPIWTAYVPALASLALLLAASLSSALAALRAMARARHGG